MGAGKTVHVVNNPGNPGMNFTKTETEYNMKSIRFLLMTITAMFILIGALLIVMGISVYGHYHGFSFFYESGNTSWIMTPSALSVFLGLALLIVAIFGFFGSLKLSTCMVNIYACILTTVFIMKLVIVILAFTIDGDKILGHIEVPYWGYNDPEVQAEINALQSRFSCCGSSSFLDYMRVEFTNNQTTVSATVLVEGQSITMTLPRDCCLISTGDVCERVTALGCKDALVTALVQNSTIIGVLGISVMFINLLGIIFALLLARAIRKMKSERAFLAWKIKEQLILAKQAEELHKIEQNQVYIDPQASSTA